MANPLIMFENTLLESGTLSLSTGSTASGFPLTNVNDWRYATPYRWKTGSTANTTIHIDYATEAVVDTLVIGGHNMATIGATVGVWRSANDADWTQVFAAAAPSSDKPFIRAGSDNTPAQYWEIRFLNGAWSAALQVGIITMGRRMDIEGGCLSSLDPYGFSVVTDSISAESGSPIGTNVRYVEKRFALNYGADGGPGLTRDGFFTPSSGISFDADFTPHVQEDKPFWFAWNADVVDSQQVYLCRNTGRISMPFDQTVLRRALVCEFSAYAEVS